MLQEKTGYSSSEAHIPFVPPPISSVLINAIRILMEEDVNIEELAEVVESDPALVMKVLDLVNRASTGIKNIKSIQHAIVLLGLDVIRYTFIRMLIDSFRTSETENSPSTMERYYGFLWVHLLTTAFLARFIAVETRPEKSFSAFLGGLFHDLGRVFYVFRLPDKYDQYIKKVLIVGKNSDDFCKIERKIFGVDHVETGVQIFESYNLPSEILESIKIHHSLFSILQNSSSHTTPSLSSVSSETLFVASVVRLADILSGSFFSPHPFSSISRDREEYNELVKRLELDTHMVQESLNKTSKEYNKYARIFGFHKNLSELYKDLFFQSKRNIKWLTSRILQLEKKTEDVHRIMLLNYLTMGMIHEVNNLLTIMGNNIQTLIFLSSSSDNKQLESEKKLSDLEKLFDRVSTILNRLLIFASSSSSVVEKNIKVPVSLNEILERVIGFVSPMFDRVNIELIKYLNNVPPVMGDPFAFEQIFLNILLNARHATKNAPEKKVIIKTEKKNEKEVQVIIKDTGCGISSENLNKIFKPFFTTKTQEEGTGLGLSISLTMLREYGGNMEIRSEEHKGTEVIVTLPIARRETKEDKKVKIDKNVKNRLAMY